MRVDLVPSAEPALLDRLSRLAEEAFGTGNVEARSFGNVLSAAGFLYGLAASDLKAEELAARDRLYEVIVGVRAVKR